MTRKSYKRLKLDKDVILDAEHLDSSQQARQNVLKEAFGITEDELQAILRDPEVIAEANRLGMDEMWKKYVTKETAQNLLAASRKVRRRG